MDWATLSSRKSTDANGWTVLDFGAWKQAFKKVTNSSFSLANNSIAVSGASSVNLPVGVSTVAGLLSLSATPSLSSSAGNLTFTLEVSDSSTSIGFTVSNRSGGTVAGTHIAYYTVTW